MNIGQLITLGVSLAGAALVLAVASLFHLDNVFMALITAGLSIGYVFFAITLKNK